MPHLSLPRRVNSGENGGRSLASGVEVKGKLAKLETGVARGGEIELLDMWRGHSETELGGKGIIPCHGYKGMQ